jgi:hypothetical protein
MKLDFLIFGKGHGLAQPWASGAFYWLVQPDGRGAFYHWDGWFGAQLSSFQWTHPNSGERRSFDALDGRVFRPAHSERCLGRVRVAWALVDLPPNTDEANKALHALKSALADLP